MSITGALLWKGLRLKVLSQVSNAWRSLMSARWFSRKQRGNSVTQWPRDITDTLRVLNYFYCTSEILKKRKENQTDNYKRLWKVPSVSSPPYDPLVVEGTLSDASWLRCRHHHRLCGWNRKAQL